MSDLKDRLARKAQLSPMMGGGSLSVGADGKYVATSYITDDGMRLVNPDGPEALAYIETLETQLAEARGKALEEAAKVAERCLPGSSLGTDISQAICALKGTPTPTCRICGHTTDSKIHEWCERKDNV